MPALWYLVAAHARNNHFAGNVLYFATVPQVENPKSVRMSKCPYDWL